MVLLFFLGEPVLSSLIGLPIAEKSRVMMELSIITHKYQRGEPG
jgi:hypothetical protein